MMESRNQEVFNSCTRSRCGRKASMYEACSLRPVPSVDLYQFPIWVVITDVKRDHVTTTRLSHHKDTRFPECIDASKAVMGPEKYSVCQTTRDQTASGLPREQYGVKRVLSRRRVFIARSPRKLYGSSHPPACVSLLMRISLLKPRVRS